MSQLFNRIPGFVTTQPGKERQVLRLLPKAFIFGSLLLALPSLALRLLLLLAPELVAATRLSTVDIYAISLLILHWTVIFTVAIAAFIIMAMKGPAYVADPYPLNDADTLDQSASDRPS